MSTGRFSYTPSQPHKQKSNDTEADINLSIESDDKVPHTEMKKSLKHKLMVFTPLYNESSISHDIKTFNVDSHSSKVAVERNTILQSDCYSNENLENQKFF